MKSFFAKPLVVALILCAIIDMIAASNVFLGLDSTLNDAIYQRDSVPQGNVLIIGIDAESIEEFGPFPWSRDVIASLIEVLNENPQTKPAVIGIDVLFTGESDPTADTLLVEACEKSGNIVLAAEGNFTSKLIVQGDDFYMDDYYIDRFEVPFPALKDVVRIGHINSMYDTGGILRHSILYLDLPDGRRIPSFALEVYRQFCEISQLDIGELPKTDNKARWYLPFSGNPLTYDDGFSVSNVLSGEIDSQVFADSIVLIGPYDTGMQDHFITAIDHAVPMYGVEYQANAIDALITQNFKTVLPDSVQFLILFMISVGSLLFYRKRKVAIVTATWFLSCVCWLIACYVVFELGYLLHSLWVLLAVTAIYVGSVAVNYAVAIIENRHVTNTFKKYVAPEIVVEILKEGSDKLGLGGKLTDIAVLFVDIRGFTPMTEILEPTQVVGILNKYLSLTSDCILKNGGTLDKFIGDATMAYWGAPLEQEDIIFKAIKTASDMIKGSKDLNEEVSKSYGREISFGIGVHAGPAIVGNIGAEIRMDFTAIGDTVNIASRLESIAPGGKILISKAVADAIKGRVLTSSFGSNIELKGKTESFEVFVVDDIIDENSTTKPN